MPANRRCSALAEEGADAVRIVGLGEVPGTSRFDRDAARVGLSRHETKDSEAMAHKKGQGSSRNGRDSNPKMLGIKLYGGQYAKPGSIICRQNGTKWHARQERRRSAATGRSSR